MSVNRGKDKEMGYIYIMDYFSAIVPFAEMCIDLETVIQSKICHKEESKCHIMSLIYGILKKNDTDEFTCKAEIETQMQRTNMDTKWGRRQGMNWVIGINIYTLLCKK